MPLRTVHQNSLLATAQRQIVCYPTPANLSINWGWGSTLGVLMGIQIVTGLLLGQHYVATGGDAFQMTLRLTSQVPNGCILRHAHAQGASSIFLLFYLHILRGVCFGSGHGPRGMVWALGVPLLLLATLTGFMGYVLPYGQMSYWGATVITGLAGVVGGHQALAWLWGGMGVGAPTLNRLASLHYAFPFLLAGLAIVHIVVLHQYGSSNPLGVNSTGASVSFLPAVGLKDLAVWCVAIVVSVALAFEPASHANAQPANPASTPAHIVPEWYFLWVYGILRCVPDKVLGVAAAGAAFAVLAALPMLLAGTRSRGASAAAAAILCIALQLTALASQPMSPATLATSQALTFAYFTIPTLILPLLFLGHKVRWG